ncbi:MAG: hypothetical protein K8Q99_04470 [Acholeplasmataceae bacterium]|nr:hypothetical protein [Acholeplasmataceae bacterium]
MKLFEIIKEEKKQMNPIRAKVNYVIVPLFLLLGFGTLIAITILMSIDEVRYLPHFIGGMIFFGVLCVIILISVPFTRKIELRLENSKYDFSYTQLDDIESIEVEPFEGADEGTKVIFNNNGLNTYGQQYDYNHFEISFITSNKYNQIFLGVRFLLLNTNEEFDPFLTFKFDGKFYSIIKHFEIPINNRQVMEYLLENKEDAFKQIYNYGYIKKI